MYHTTQVPMCQTIEYDAENKFIFRLTLVFKRVSMVVLKFRKKISCTDSRYYCTSGRLGRRVVG